MKSLGWCCRTTTIVAQRINRFHFLAHLKTEPDTKVSRPYNLNKKSCRYVLGPSHEDIFLGRQIIPIGSFQTFIVARDHGSGQWIVADENAMLVSHDGEGALSDQMKTYLQLKFN